MKNHDKVSKNAKEDIEKTTSIKASKDQREKIIRKTYALTKQDLANIELIKDKCLNRKIVLNDSHVIRTALRLAAELSENTLVKESLLTPKMITGRPKGS